MNLDVIFKFLTYIAQKQKKFLITIIKKKKNKILIIKKYLYADNQLYIF